MRKLLLIFLLVIGMFASESITLSTGEWAPYTSNTDTKGKIVQEIVSEAFKFENIDVKYEFFSWNEAYEKAQKGLYSGTMPWFKTEDRAKDFYFSKPIIRTKTVFFHLKSLAFKWDSLEDIKNYKVGATTGYKSAKFLSEKDIDVKLVSDEKENFNKLLTGEIDIAPSSFLVGYNIINKMYTPDKAMLFTNHAKQIFPGTAVYLLISKQNANSQELIKKFDKGLLKLIKSGRYVQIIKMATKK